MLHVWAAAVVLVLLAEAPIAWLNAWAEMVGRHVPLIQQLNGATGNVEIVVARFYALACALVALSVLYLSIGDDPLYRLRTGLQLQGGWAWLGVCAGLAAADSWVNRG